MKKNDPISMFQSGRFVVGCNYWASHAGTRMWSDWQPAVIRRDLRLLARAGLQVLRVFPLWPDFQPISSLSSGGGNPREYAFGETPLPDTDAGRAGMNPEALEHFKFFADEAGRNGLKLVVGLITGWMSGRLFTPPALNGANVITNPAALMWQTRFVRHFVTRFREHPAIAAWDLGNECNCMGQAANRNEAWVWTSALTHAIRAADPTRPIVSGMHSLQPDVHAGSWLIQDQAELTDVLTTHPYPYWCRHTGQDPVDTIRTTLHATAESRFYCDIGGKPCLAEEIGTMGPMVADDEKARRFVRTNLFSLWAHDCLGLLWWCAFDQTALGHMPYDWIAVEQELGLFRTNGRPRPVAKELGLFRNFIDKLPFPSLPPRQREAVCILTEGQDTWGAAYSSFVLARQAGFDLEFQYSEQPLKDAPLYLMPSITGLFAIRRRRWLELLERVRAGASLYVSIGSALISGFEEIFGVRVQSRIDHPAIAREVTIMLPGLPGSPQLHMSNSVEFRMAATRAKTIGIEPDGNPIFTKSSYGKGQVYMFSQPLEHFLATKPGAFHDQAADPYWLVYRQLAQDCLHGRVVRKCSPFVAATEHPFSATRRAVILINHDTQAHNEPLVLKKGWRIGRTLHGMRPVRKGADLLCRLPANDAAVFIVEKG